MENEREIKVCNISEILPGQAKSFIIEEKEIGVFNINGKFYALDNMCIHAGAPLSDSFIDEENCQVVCSWHSWAFDIPTGKCVSHPRQDVFQQNYIVIVKDDELYIKLL